MVRFQSHFMCIIALCGLIIAACVSGCREQVIAARGANLLVVNFEQNKTLRYRMVSTRETSIELTSSGSGSKQGNPQKVTETLEMVMAYKPTQVDPFGLTKLECVCESVSVARGSFTGKSPQSGDAIENLKGKPFTLELSPTGKIQDFSGLEKLLLEIGKTAFDTTRKDISIKNPDMIYDFVAMQWYLWDSIASVPNPLDGVQPGMQWTNTQVVAWPIPIPNTPCRVTTYTLDSVQQDQDGQAAKALINTTYRLSEKTLEEFPKPYEGSFQMRGLFGFLHNYQFQSIDGGGKILFDLTSGTVISDTQQYKLVANAAFLLPLGDSVPSVVIEQKIDIQLLENQP